MSTTGSKATHLLLYPYPTAGHIIPMLDLARTLLQYNQFTITLLATPPNLPLLNPLLSLFPSSFHYLLLPFEPPPLLPNQHFTFKVISLHILDPQIEAWFISHPSPPVAIISDFFLGWTQSLALKLGIKRLVFSPSGAFALSVANSIWSRPVNNESPPPSDDSRVEFSDLPDSPTFQWWQISQLYRRATINQQHNQDWDFFRSSWLQNLQSWGTIINTFTSLESKHINHLKSTNHRTFSIGPLLQNNPQSSDRGGTNTIPLNNIINWLDLKSADRASDSNSIVYVCFGTRCALSKKQIHVITEALDRSGVSFILSIRSYDGSHSNQVAQNDVGEIPEGYETRVEGRGLVIRGWAPQMEILKHHAVGAFLTHCGWNSVLEGLSAGVVMLTWPMGADQFTNGKLLVDEVGVGIRVGEGTRVVPEVDELVDVLVRAVDPTRVESKRALELKDAARAAVSKGGSSDEDLEELVAQLRQL